jgi:hypothetical protein
MERKEEEIMNEENVNKNEIKRRERGRNKGMMVEEGKIMKNKMKL